MGGLRRIWLDELGAGHSSGSSSELVQYFIAHEIARKGQRIIYWAVVTLSVRAIGVFKQDRDADEQP